MPRKLSPSQRQKLLDLLLGELRCAHKAAFADDVDRITHNPIVDEPLGRLSRWITPTAGSTTGPCMRPGEDGLRAEGIGRSSSNDGERHMGTRTEPDHGVICWRLWGTAGRCAWLEALY